MEVMNWMEVATERLDSGVCRSLLNRSDVDVRPAPDAAVCGASGCTETAQLLRGVIEDYGRRVLCADHMANLIHREVLNG